MVIHTGDKVIGYRYSFKIRYSKAEVPVSMSITDRCLKVKKVTIVEIGVKSTVNEVVLGVTTGKGWAPNNG